MNWQAYLYAHLPVFAGITATGVGVLKATLAAPDHTLTAGARWALCGGPATFLIALAAMHLVNAGYSTPAASGSRLGAGLALAGLAPIGSGLSPLVLEAIVLAVLVMHVGFETSRPDTASVSNTTQPE